MKSMRLLFLTLSIAQLNAAAMSGALRRGLSQSTALRGSSAMPTFTPSAATLSIPTGSLLQPKLFLSSQSSQLYMGPTMRLYGQSTAGHAAGSQQQNRYSARQIAAVILGLGATAKTLASNIEDKELYKQHQLNKLYDTYAAQYGSIAGLLKREDAVRTKMSLARIPEVAAVELAQLIATAKGSDAVTIFTDPQAVATVSMLAAKDAQAEQILVDKFAQLIQNGTVTCCANFAQRKLLGQFIDADVSGANALKLAIALPWPASLGSGAQSWYTLLKEDADIAKTQRWEGGWWSGKYVSTGENPTDGEQTVLRRLAAKNPQAAQEITDRIIAQSALKGYNELPFYTIAFLVSNSPYAAQKFAQNLSELQFAQMVAHQNIAPETANALWQELKVAPAAGRLQE